ncbi:MAG: DUF6290 family protein [Eggerthellaceae bacterium]|nr:DUF6290 family protein [Eggerthellaceae bacterium]
MPKTATKPSEAENDTRKLPAKNQRQSVSVRLSAAEKSLIESYAKAQRRSVSDVIRFVALEKIEAEYDLAWFVEAKRDHERNPGTVTHAEMMKKHGLDA